MIDWDWVLHKTLRVCPPLILAGYLFRKTYSLFFLPFQANDFLEFWVAATLTLAGNAAAVYDFSQFQPALTTAAGAPFLTPWFYPPIYLLMVLPFGLLPYYAAMALWLMINLGIYLWVVRAIAPHPLTLWLALAFPGALLNLDYGQNGLLSTALLGGGLLLLSRSPYLAGILLGLLWYKPNLALLIPVALIAGRCWRALGASLATALVLALGSGLIFGWQVWGEFWRVLPQPLEAMKTGAAALEQMPTVLSMARMAGGSLTLASVFQVIVALMVLGMTIWVWAQGAPLALRASLLVLGTLLFTPYASQYELARLALPLAWVGWEVAAQHVGPGEKLFLVLGWLTPMISAALAKAHLVQVIPLLLMGFVYLLIKSPSLWLPRKTSPQAGG